MAFPKLLQKLFQNNGAGDKLNQDIIPDIPYSKVTDAPSVDSALSSTSENPVQNKVVKSALDGKLSTSGGTMAGDIQFSAGDIWFNKQTLGIRGRTNDTYLEISPGPSNSYASAKGASLMMSGRDYTGGNMPKGAFALAAASDANTSVTLAGYPDGRLTWRGKDVITVVAESYGANSWYRKYSDGWIEQGGRITAEGYQKVAITLSVPFSNTNYTILIGESTMYLGYGAQNCTVFKETVTKTGFTLEQNDNNSGGSWWMACGR